MKSTGITRNLILSTVICLAAFTGFSKISQPGNGIQQKLVGEWRNIYLKIVTHHPGKEPQIIKADSANWVATLGIKPIRTHFNGDGSYYSEYRTPKDSLFKTASGTWLVRNDSLIMSQQKPVTSLLKLHVKLDNDIATFSGVIDFEGDGLADDEYLGMQRKFK